VSGLTFLEAVMADEQRDVIEILIHDHREVETMFAEMETLRGKTDDASLTRLKDLTDQATIELSARTLSADAEHPTERW
jgi:hypothetical protein